MKFIILTLIHTSYFVQFLADLFPRLRLNEVLRLRRVCKWTEFCANNYLRLHPRSKNKISLSLNAHVGQDDDEDQGIDQGEETENHFSFPLKAFLLKDNNSTIRRPVTRFQIAVKSPPHSFKNPLISEFLEKYGHQVEELEVNVMSFPMDEYEFKFYEQLPKLRSLSVTMLKEEILKEVTDGENESVVFPKNFKALRKLEIVERKGVEGRPLHFLKLIEFCKKLEHLLLPLFHFEGRSKPEISVSQVTELQRVLNLKEHKQFKFLDISRIFQSLANSADLRLMLTILHDLTMTHEVDLINVRASLLFKIENFDVFSQIARRVISVVGLNSEYCLFNVLPNVRSSEVEFFTRQHVVYVAPPPPRPEVFPGLRKLEINTWGTKVSLEHIWNEFPSLEEVTITTSNYFPSDAVPVENPVDVVFTGDDVNRPAFLQLTSEYLEV